MTEHPHAWVLRAIADGEPLENFELKNHKWSDDNIYGWHFLHEGHKLRDGSTAPEDGQWMSVANPKMCERGLHGSRTPWQALQYAPGPILCLCEFSAPADEHPNDKFVSSSRRIIARFDATEMLMFHARMQALSVIHLWDAPDVVLDYLMTGSEALRAAARDAARDAALAAVMDAAGAAAWATAGASARAAARDAAWAAAEASARDAAGAEFDSLVYECFEGPLAEVGW